MKTKCETVKESLENGFSRILVKRASGISKGIYDIYVFAPNRQKFRSKNELRKYLSAHPGEKIDVDAAFRRPKALQGKPSKGTLKKKNVLKVKMNSAKKEEKVQLASKGNSTFKLKNADQNHLTLKQKDKLAEDAGLRIARVVIRRLNVEEFEEEEEKEEAFGFMEGQEFVENPPIDCGELSFVPFGEDISADEMDSSESGDCAKFEEIFVFPDTYSPEMQSGSSPFAGFPQDSQVANVASDESCSSNDCQQTLVGNQPLDEPSWNVTNMKRKLAKLEAKYVKIEKQCIEFARTVQHLEEKVDHIAEENKKLHESNSFLKLKLIANQLSSEITITKV